MSTDPVSTLIHRLELSSKTIAEAYYHGRVHKNDENARDIERLRQLRLLSPDIRDAFQLRASFRHFLNAALNTERLFSMGANIGGHFQRLAALVDGHSLAYQDGRDADCERYEVETREAISDIADAIDDELTVLQAQVATRFAAVSTIAEKKRQNLHYQKRTQQLVDLLESFHFSDIGEQLSGHEDLALSFKSLLADRIPAFRAALLSILDTLSQYLFEFRKIEQRAQQVHAFSLHLARNPDWTPKAWDEAAEPPDWLCCALPMNFDAHPDVSDPTYTALLAEIARTIPESMINKIKKTREEGGFVEAAENDKIVLPEPPIRKAVRQYFREASQSSSEISARGWWAKNPVLLSNIKEEIWLLRVMMEHDNKGDSGRWRLRMVSRPSPDFDGNVLVRDIMVAKRAA